MADVKQRAGVRSRRLTLFLVAVSVILALQVLWISRKNYSLRRQVSALPRQVAVRKVLEAGDSLAPFDLRYAGGEVESTSFDGQGQHMLMYVFANECEACAVLGGVKGL